MKQSLPWESVPPPIFPAQLTLKPRKKWVQVGGWILVVLLLLYGVSLRGRNPLLSIISLVFSVMYLVTMMTKKDAALTSRGLEIFYDMQFTTNYEFFPWEDISVIVCEDRNHAELVRLHIGYGNAEKAFFFPREDLDEIYDKFHDFMGLVPEDGVIVACGEEPHVVEIARSEGRRMYTYGFNEGCDVRIISYEPHGIGSRYAAVMPDGTQVEGAIKQNPGRHNVLNATGVITLLWALGFDAAKVAQALSGFAGVRRRFDLVGEVGGVTVVDDYAHHPTEIAATISAAAGLGYKHVHVLFQPHRYSRAPLFTQVLHDEFGAAFDKADSVTFMDVYPAGEAPVPGVSGKTFLNVVLEHEGHPQADFVAHRVDVVPHLMEKLQPGDLVITMGAGDVTAMGPQIIDALLKARG